jgi:hypothetical protein
MMKGMAFSHAQNDDYLMNARTVNIEKELFEEIEVTKEYMETHYYM